ncbi:MAG: recombinase-like helix-turn-helix domain-containing protein [Burkholderiales bacterium]
MKLFPDFDRIPEPYSQWRQSASRAPTDYEGQLGDAIEAAFADGAWELPALVARLNTDCIRTPEGTAWTEERFRVVMAALGEGMPTQGKGAPL